MNRYSNGDSSDFDYFYRLDVNDTNATNAIIQGEELKFLIHGYTDRVQFNRTGLSSSYSPY